MSLYIPVVNAHIFSGQYVGDTQFKSRENSSEAASSRAASGGAGEKMLTFVPFIPLYSITVLSLPSCLGTEAGAPLNLI